MKILFITSTHLGDAILSTGILRELIHRHPHAHFTVVCGPVPAPLFENISGLITVIPLYKKRFSSHWARLWQKNFGRFWDIVVDLRGTALSYMLITRKKYILRGGNKNIPKVQQLSDLMGLPSVPWNHLWLSAADKNAALLLLPHGHDYIVLSPTANWAEKCWPLSFYTELGRRFLDSAVFKNPKLVIVGAAFQRHEVQELLNGFSNDQVIDLVGKPNLPVLAACFKQCRLFIGNDSGLMHMAATMEIPTVGIFGPSPVEIYAPWGLKTAVVKIPGSYEIIFQEAVEGKKVMEKITVDQVYEASLNLLLKQ